MAMTVGIFILVCARAAATRTSCEGTSSAHSDGSVVVHHGFHHGGIALPIWLAVNHSWNGTNGMYDNNDIYANPAQFHRWGGGRKYPPRRTKWMYVPPDVNDERELPEVFIGSEKIERVH